MGLKEKLDSGEFVILAAIDPPKGVDVSLMVACAMQTKGSVDAFVVPQMSNGVMRMSALGGAIILQQNGIEAVMEISCRDRNRLAIQGDLLAAHACGVTNLVAVTGPDPASGDHHEANAVDDIHLRELLDVTQTLQQGRDMAGLDLAGSPSFLVGSTVNAGAKDRALDQELEEMAQKIEKGVRFLITPPVFDLTFIDPFLQRVDRRKVNIIPTVMLLKSVGMARYIDRHHDDVHVPDAVINRIQHAQDRIAECIRVATEMITTLKNESFTGALITTLGWENRLPDILGTVAE
jgi:methylenetetrahydrofolate reductase (NADPH)